MMESCFSELMEFGFKAMDRIDEEKGRLLLK